MQNAEMMGDTLILLIPSANKLRLGERTLADDRSREISKIRYPIDDR